MRATNQHYWRDSTLPFIELRSTYRSLQSYKPHFHPQLSFGAVIAGKTRANCGGREFLLQQGDLVLIPSYVVHSCNPIDRQPRSYHMLYLDQAWCLENMSPLHARPLADLCSSAIVIRDSGLFARYLELVASLADLCATEASSQTRRLLSDAVDSIRPAATPPQSQQLGERIKQALLDNVESPPTLDELACAFGCRKETLIRVFRRAFHTTPHAFVNSARIERVKQRLKLGEKIAHVAADLGFSDQAQLHRTFVSYTASTPGQYRRARAAARVNFRQ
jgi:AraC-like DNA-binding protein